MNKAKILKGLAKTILLINIIIVNIVLMLWLSMQIMNIINMENIYLLFIPIFLFGFLTVFLAEYVLEIKD
ncbi:MAG: hypothetical protein QXI91_05540 [Candidatus Bathyarchaeia archaeon]